MTDEQVHALAVAILSAWLALGAASLYFHSVAGVVVWVIILAGLLAG